MNFLKNLNPFTKTSKLNWGLIILFLLLFIVLIINQLHAAYPDEFESIVAGYYIVHGKLPYTGFFTHHNPFAYFFAAPIAGTVQALLVAVWTEWKETHPSEFAKGKRKTVNPKLVV